MAKHLLTLHEVRGLLALLGILLHCSAIFAVTGNPLAPRPEYFIFTGITNLIHSFRMEAFFVIGGLAIAMLSSRESNVLLLLDSRCRRLALPMVWTLLLLNLPLLFIAMTIGQGPTIYNSSTLSVIDLLEFHLWFLRDLMGFTIIYCVALMFFSKHKKDLDQGQEQPMLSSQYWMLAVPIALSVPIVIGHFFPALHRPLPTLESGMHWLHYGSYFAFGICIYRRSEWLRVVATVSRPRLLIALIICLLFWVLKFLVPANSNNILKFILACFENANTLALSYLCVHIASVLNRTLDWALPGWSRASYSIYLTHYPVICLLALASQNLYLNDVAEFTLLLLSATLLTYWISQHLLPRVDAFAKRMGLAITR